MTDLEYALISSLRQQGYAVLVLHPRELGGLAPHVVEHRLSVAAVETVHRLLNPEESDQ